MEIGPWASVKDFRLGTKNGENYLVGLREAMQVMPAQTITPVATIVPMGDVHEAACWQLAQSLRKDGLAVDIAFRGKPGKRMQRADKAGIRYAVIIGDDEAASGEVTLKEFATGEQQRLTQEALAKTLQTKQ